MKPTPKGFNLLELTMAMVVVAILATPLMTAFGNIQYSIIYDQQLQIGSELALERAEELFMIRRNLGYAALPGSGTDTLPPAYAAYTRTLTVTDPFTGTPCPLAATCKEFVVTVTSATSTLSTITLVFVDA
ncbi:MAG TPA: hypothetical protein DCZ03_03350 [Gammaproteobacteria bacterium]|nr:hypothetical protein [Gammaproteobacteria bacterium]